jgi:hypothetical protein
MKLLINTLGLVAASILLASSTVRAGPYDLLHTPVNRGNAGPYATSLKGTLALGSFDPSPGWPITGFASDDGPAVFSGRGYGIRGSSGAATFPLLSGAGLRLAARISLRAGLSADRADGIWPLSRAVSVPDGRMTAENVALALAGLAVVAGICRHRSWSLAGA